MTGSLGWQATIVTREVGRPLPEGNPASICLATGQDVADDVFYQFMPIAWRDSDGDANRFGDFGGMAASVPYLQSLGVTAVWMNPIFPSPAYHGYQHRKIF